MPVSKADMNEKNPAEYQEGARRAREARAHVARQLAESIESADLTGSHPFVAKRFGSYVAAVKSGDDLASRAALMELASAAGATIAALDLSMARDTA